MTKPPRVSVVMTTYNASRHLRETIEGILAQTFADYEFVIIDDCSSDDTVAIVESYRDPRIRLIRNPENKGISATRNIGIEAARGDYLAALDHDDISLPERLARQVAFLDAHPRAVLVATAAKLLENGKIRDYYPPVTEPHLLRWTLFTRCPLIHSSICMRVKTLREHNLRYRREYHYAEDFDLYHRLAEIGDLACLPERLTIYREHGGNASTRHAEAMNRHGRAFMLDVYRKLLGPDVAPEDVARVWKLVTCGGAAVDRAEVEAVGAFLARLLAAFLDRVPLSAEQAEEVRRAAAQTWWRVVRRAAQDLGPGTLGIFSAHPTLTALRPAAGERLAVGLRALLGPRLVGAIRTPVRRIFPGRW